MTNDGRETRGPLRESDGGRPRRTRSPSAIYLKPAPRLLLRAFPLLAQVVRILADLETLVLLGDLLDRLHRVVRRRVVLPLGVLERGLALLLERVHRRLHAAFLEARRDRLGVVDLPERLHRLVDLVGVGVLLRLLDVVQRRVVLRARHARAELLLGLLELLDRRADGRVDLVHLPDV